MTDSAAAYAELRARFGRAARLRAAEELLGWDAEVTMPRTAASARGDIVGELHRAWQSELERDDMGQLLAEAAGSEDVAGGDGWRRADLAEMRRRWLRNDAVPSALLHSIATAREAARAAWASARQGGDEAAYLEALAVLLPLQIEAAKRRGERLGCDAYDALLDEWDPGRRFATLAPLFDTVAAQVPRLLATAPEPVAPINPLASAEQQLAAVRTLLKEIDPYGSIGRIDLAAHPFTLALVPGDIRLTTRTLPDDLRMAVVAAFHEAGHAFYEAGLPAEHRFAPVGDACGGTLHESQALLFERHAMYAALPWLAARLGALLPALAGVTPASLRRAWRHPAPGSLRVHADEARYALHIVLRVELERALVGGTLAVRDLPEAWAARQHELFGTSPATAADGWLQDIHWAVGLFGYFATYLAGAMLAAQFYEIARRDVHGLEARLAAGDFTALRGWATERIHRWGSYELPDTIVHRVTGGPLCADAYLRHLNAVFAPDA